MEYDYIDKLNCLVDLHLHLDGAISLNSAKDLARLQNISIPNNDDEIINLLRVSDDCKNLAEFLEKFTFPLTLLQTKIGIKTAVENLLAELEHNGLMYAEIRFAPQLHTDKGLSQEEVVQSAIEGVRNSNLPANLILCCMSFDNNNNENIETVNIAKKYLNKGVVAVDLAGGEKENGISLYNYIFDLAKKLDVPFVIHAGEAAGASNVKTAIEIGASRIGHGVRACEDINVIKELKEKKIPLELCPTSNIKTKVFTKMEDYPIRFLIDNGVIVTINSDDPSVEGIELKDDYKNMIKYHNLSKNEIKQILCNSVEYSFANEELKDKLLKKINIM